MGPIYVPPFPTLGGKQFWGDVHLHAGYRIQRNTVTGHHRLLSPTDIRLAVGDFDACQEALGRFLALHRPARPADAPRPPIGGPDGHLVVLLHGIFRAKESFGPMVGALRAAGYEAHSVNYPSTRQTLEDHADQVEALLENHWKHVPSGARTVSFVTHSMGGIVARVLLGRLDRPWRQRTAVNRLVMLGTPNQGAEIIDTIDRHVPAFDAIAGPALRQLRPSAARVIPRPTVPFGIVAGARGDGRGYNPLLSGDNDMTVTLDSTRLEGAEDFLVVPVVHTLLPVHPIVVRATLSFLATGRFQA